MNRDMRMSVGLASTVIPISVTNQTPAMRLGGRMISLQAMVHSPILP